MKKVMRFLGLFVAVSMFGGCDANPVNPLEQTLCTWSDTCDIGPPYRVRLSGYVTENGVPVATAKVTLRQKGVEVAASLTDSIGFYGVGHSGPTKKACDDLAVHFRHPDGRTATLFRSNGCKSHGQSYSYDFK